MQRYTPLNYIPATKFTLAIALLDFWTMIEQGHFWEASHLHTKLIVEQAMRAEITTSYKSHHYIERAVTFDDLYEAAHGDAPGARL